MRIRYTCLVLGLLLLVPTSARADSHNADAYGGGSGGGGGSTLGGFIVAFGKTQLQDGRKKVLLGGAGGASVQFGTHNDRQVTQVIWGVGPRFTIAPTGTRNFFHTMVQLSGVYTNDGRDIQNGKEKPNDFAVVVGAAYDHALTGAHSSSTAVAGLALRAQADRVFNLGDREHVWRLSMGLIYRIPRV